MTFCANREFVIYDSQLTLNPVHSTYTYAHHKVHLWYDY